MRPITAGPKETGTEVHESLSTDRSTASNRTNTATSGSVVVPSAQVAVTRNWACLESSVTEPCIERLNEASSNVEVAFVPSSWGIPVRFTGMVADPATAAASMAALAPLYVAPSRSTTSVAAPGVAVTVTLRIDCPDARAEKNAAPKPTIASIKKPVRESARARPIQR